MVSVEQVEAYDGWPSADWFDLVGVRELGDRWREFAITSDQMTPGSTRRIWEATTCMTLRAYPAGGQEISVADMRLLPARPGDLPEPGAPVKRSVAIYGSRTPPIIDGYGNDACWTDCETVTDFYKYSTEKPADAKTNVKLCYDEEDLYMLFESLEPITSLGATRANEFQVFTSDHAHLFLDPFKDLAHYFEIGIDTAGTVADIRNGESGWDIKWNGQYEVKTGLNYNVGWTVEMKIPFSALGKTPKPGDVWGATFARVDVAKEFSMWTTGEWNDPAGFGDLVFKGEAR